MGRPPAAANPLATYRAKRRFQETPEPKGRKARKAGRSFVIQKHAATRLHYDFRLELDGVMLSWAVTRGPSLNPADKRLAVRTEDHPLDYSGFEGRIPAGNYGAGTVLLWDRGDWAPVGDPHRGLRDGKLAFELYGERLRGRWALVRFKGQEGGKRENWLLIKERDDAADPEADVTREHVTSVASGRSIEAIAASPEAVWKGGAATPVRLPDFVAPALATLVEEVPTAKGWLFEMKFDGYRAIAALSGDRVRIYTRNALDWTERYPAIATALAKLGAEDALLDGEIVVVDKEGRSDFGALQRALKGEGGGLSYFVFDLLAEKGKDLTHRPLVERKARLRKLLGARGRKGPVFYTDHIQGDGRGMLDALCAKGFEGIVAKRADAPYRSGRSRSWLKIKCGRAQEFVIVGWADSTRDRPFASILLAVNENGALRYAGKVGSGFSQSDLASFADRFRKRARRTAPVADVPAPVRRTAHWVRPDLVANIAFAEFTPDGLIRQGRFLGLREDKPAKAVTRERPADALAPSMESGAMRGIVLTNPDKVLFPEQGLTKRDLAAYLDAVADRMLPHAANRLVSLVRCPQGRAKHCFFQKHGEAGLAPHFKTQAVQAKSGGTDRYLYLTGAAGLIAAAQMGALELHIWGSRVDDIEKPDRIVFDLDPDETVSFETVKKAAKAMRDTLDALGLKSFPLLTGGKGIHVVAPIQRRHEWPAVKAFAKALATRIAEADPQNYIATMSKAKRKGRIFIDYLRNERGSTAIAPYSARARPGAPVAWPVGWDRLDGFDSAAAVTVANAAERLGEPDPWPDYARTRQGLTAAALRALGVDQAP